MAVSSRANQENMRLTQSTRLLSQPTDSFPVKQLFLLAICRVAEPIALTSIFPYSWLMVKSYAIGNTNDASFYAGILISAFALSECITGVFWGGLSDRMGRKPVLLIGCAGTMISLLIVGFATNFWVALAGRVLGGALNGNIGVIQTMVGELVKRPEHEPRAYSIMPFVWSIGTIVGPAIGGTLAQPAVAFPSKFSEAGIFGRFPYLLPNLICAGLMCVSMSLGYFFLEETHPYLRFGMSQTEVEHFAALESAVHEVVNNDQRYGTFSTGEDDDCKHGVATVIEEQEIDLLTEKPVSTGKPSIWTFQIIMLLMALALFTYHSMCFDHLLPIFLQDGSDDVIASTTYHMPSGLGLTTFQVGTIMSFAGLLEILIQTVIFPLLASWMSSVRLLLLVTLLHPLVYIPMPFLASLPSNLVYPGIYAALAFRNFTSIIAYPLLLILLKQACPSSNVLGSVNGLAASVGAAARMIAPPVAGLLYGWGANIGFTGIAYWGAALVAIIGSFQIFLVKRPKASTAVVYEAVSGEDVIINPEAEAYKGDIINVAVITITDEV